MTVPLDVCNEYIGVYTIILKIKFKIKFILNVPSIILLFAISKSHLDIYLTNLSFK